MTGTQVSNLLNTQIQLLSTDLRLSLLDEQLSSITSDQFDDIAVVQLKDSTITKEKFARFTTSALGGMTQPQFNALATSANNLFVDLSTDQIRSIPSNLFTQTETAHIERLPGSDFAKVKYDQFKNIPSTVYNNALTQVQLESIDTITGSNIFVSLTSNDVAKFDISLVNLFTNTQIGDISGDSVDGFSNDNVALFDTNLLGLLNESQVQGFTVGVDSQTKQLVVNNLSSINLLSDSQIQDLTIAQISSLSVDKITVLSAGERLGLLSPVQMTGLVDAQVTGLTTTQITKLTGDQLASIPINVLQLFSSDQVNAIGTNFNRIPVDENSNLALTTTQLASVSLDNIEKLTIGQIQSLTSEQIPVLTVSQLNRIVNIQGSESVSGTFTKNQINAMTLAQMNTRELNGTVVAHPDGELVGLFSKLTTFSSTQIEGLNKLHLVELLDVYNNIFLTLTNLQANAVFNAFTFLRYEEIRELTFDKMEYLSLDQLLSVTASQATQGAQSFSDPDRANYASKNIRALTLTGIDFALDVIPFYITSYTNTIITDPLAKALDDLTDTQLGQLSSTQISVLNSLSNIHIQSLDLSKLTGEAFSSINLNKVTQDQIVNLTSIQVANMTASNLITLQENGLVGDLSATLIQDISSDAFNNTNEFAPVIVDLTSEQVAALTSDQIIAIDTNIKDICANFIPNLVDVNALNVTVLTDDQYNNLTDVQVDSFNSEKFAQLDLSKLSENQFSNLLDQSIIDITGSQGSQLSSLFITLLSTRFSLLNTNVIPFIPLESIPSINASSVTEAQANVFTQDQVNAFTALQQSAFSAAVLTLLTDEEGFNYNLTPLEFKITQFNTSVDVESMQITISDISDVEFNYDATIQSYMTLADAKDMFKYRYSNESEIRLYVDKRHFNVYFDYLESDHLDLDNNDPVIGRHDMKYIETVSDNASVGYFTNNTSTGNLGFVGNVVTNSIVGDSRIPSSWDYIHYTAKEVLGRFSAYPLFNNIRTIEDNLRRNMNDSIRNIIKPIIESIDISSGIIVDASGDSILGAGKDTNDDPVSYPDNPTGTDGDNATPFDQALLAGVANARHVVFNNTYSSSEEISSTIFRTLLLQRKPEFNLVEEQEVAYSFPFRADDSMSFIVEMKPNDEQKRIAGTAGKSIGEKIDSRKYRVNIKFTA